MRICLMLLLAIVTILVQIGSASSMQGTAFGEIEKLKQALNASLERLLVGLPAKDGQWCQRMVRGQLEEEEKNRLAQWTFNQSQFHVAPKPDESDLLVAKTPEFREEAGCPQLRQLFPFVEQPLSEEERQFPLAYGLLVHKSPLQVLALLSAIYQPQNAYCLVFDEKSDEHFKKEMFMLADCFPNNIFVMSVGKIHWCKFGIVRAVFGCLRYLAQLDHRWQYFQYLSGVDLPLKTNLEMVRIFKQLNGTINADVLPFEDYRISGIPKSVKPPLPLWKSSLSALISRQAANAMVKSEKVQQMLRYLQYTNCSDESLWATMAGNPKGKLQIPGGFDAATLYSAALKEANFRCNQSSISSAVGHQQIAGESLSNKTMVVDPAAEPFRLSSFYISRYQLWNGVTHPNPLTHSHGQTMCNGTFASSSCVFGVGDLPSLISRPELVVHKMYLDYQPAAYFCLWKSVWERALEWREQQKFQGRVYSELAAVKLARGESVDKVRFFYDQTCHLSIS